MRQGLPQTSIVSLVLIIFLVLLRFEEFRPGDRHAVSHCLGVPLAHDGSVGSVHIVYHILDVEGHVLLVDDGRAEIVGLAHVGHIDAVVADGILELDSVLVEEFLHLLLGEGFDGFGLPVDGVAFLHERDGKGGCTLVEVPSAVLLVELHGAWDDVIDIQRHSAHGGRCLVAVTIDRAAKVASRVW